MDTLPTKPEINREKEDRKGGIAGFLSRLLGGGGSGAGGLGGVGAGAGGMGAAGAGGLLATKAGIIGLALIGTTVAGGVGVVGYKVFGPGADEGVGAAQSLFEARPASERLDATGGAGAAGAGGASNSLQFLVDANSNPAEGSEGAVADGAASDGAASAPPAEETVTASGSSSHMGTDGKANATGAGMAASKLTGAGKFGSLSKNFGGGGSGASSAGSASGTGLLASARGSSSGFAQNKNRAASAAGGGKRALATRRGGGAMRQLMGVRSDHRGNRGSSQAHGSTYDGSAGPSGTGIGGGTDIAGGGQGAGSGVADAGSGSSPYGTGPDDQLPAAPPSIEGENATPYQKALNTALLMIVGSLALCYIAGKLADTQYGKAAAVILGGIAAIMAGYAIKLGMDIGGGDYGQPLQGAMITVAGAFALLNAGICIAGSNESARTAMGDTSMLMKLAGGGAMVAMAVAFLKPMKSYPASEFENGEPPDGGFIGRAVIIRPAEGGSEQALQHILAAGPRARRSAEV